MVIPSPQLILAGVLIGILASAPVGPVNVLCIQRTLERGFIAGLMAGTGAVLGDGLIALAAAFGINAISELMDRNDRLLRIIGSIVLMLFGAKLYVTKTKFEPTREMTEAARREGLIAYLWSIPQTFFLTITNPGAVLGMFVLVSSAGAAIGGLNSATEAIALVLAVMGGGLLWWFTIARTVSVMRHKLNEGRVRLINQVSGITLIGFGLVVLGQLALKSLGLWRF